MWRLSGIHRDVFLLLKPIKSHIADFTVATPLSFGKIPARGHGAGGGDDDGSAVKQRRKTAGAGSRGEGTELLSARIDVEVLLVSSRSHADILSLVRFRC